MGKNFRKTLENQQKDPEFKKEWDNLEVETQLIKNKLKKENPDSHKKSQVHLHPQLIKFKS